MTRFEELEETHAEVKLKQTLWEAQREWGSDYDKWMTVSHTRSNIVYTRAHKSGHYPPSYTVCAIGT